MDCTKCIHYDVCEDITPTELFKSGAEQCTFFLTEEMIITRFVKKVLDNHKLS